MGLDITVLTRATDLTLIKAERPSIKVEMLRIPTLWQPLRVVTFSRAAARAAQKGRFDVVHSFSRTRHQHLFRAGGGSHREFMRRTYGSSASEKTGAAVGQSLRALSPRHRVLLSIEEAVFRDSRQRIQCASRFVANSLIHQHGVSPERILLLPNAVDAARFGSPTTRETGRRLRRELDRKAERIWLFPASGWRRKGLRVLLESIAKIRDDGLRLWIAGRDDPAPWQKIAANLGIGQRVRFIGQRDDLEIVYGAVDGMILPTRYDAFANVTLEAAASGLPIITTTANGASEWLGDALVCLDDSDDVDAFAHAIQELASSESRLQLGAKAQRLARELDWPGHARALCEEYHRIYERRIRQRQRSEGPESES
jgi:UDP-glucose:(heptosyl)LPS alpha-1,3-glucosyltransferase